MTQRNEHDEILERLLDGADPAAIEGADPAALAATAESLALLSQSSEPLAPSRGLRASILAAAVADAPLQAFSRRTARFFHIPEEEARALLASTAAVDAAPWFDDLEVAGVRMRAVAAGADLADAGCLLVHMAPGVRYPTHLHTRDEWCLFLQGRVLEAGREWNPGDLVLNRKGSEHAVLASVAQEPSVFALVLREPPGSGSGAPDPEDPPA